MLVVAPAAALKVGTTRRNAISGRFDYSFELSAHKSGLLLGHISFDPLAFEHEWDKDALTWAMFVGGKTGEAVAAVNRFFDGQFHAVDSKWRDPRRDACIRHFAQSRRRVRL